MGKNDILAVYSSYCHSKLSVSDFKYCIQDQLWYKTEYEKLLLKVNSIINDFEKGNYSFAVFKLTLEKAFKPIMKAV